jgi:hypothetical protein
LCLASPMRGARVASRPRAGGFKGRGIGNFDTFSLGRAWSRLSTAEDERLCRRQPGTGEKSVWRRVPNPRELVFARIRTLGISGTQMADSAGRAGRGLL